MVVERENFLKKIAEIKTWRSGERRAPHKPLLILFAISEFLRGHRVVEFTAVEETLRPLLNAYAPPVVGKHQPELPYWYLTYDGFWEIDEPERLARQKSGFPKIGALRGSTAHFTEEFSSYLLKHPEISREVIHLILQEHFPPSIHEDILNAFGLDLEADVLNPELQELKKKKRDPKFRDNVLRAYEHRCVVTGFRAALSGSFFGCEAAHVQWHAYDGPDDVSNGIALEPTVHKLYDAGAWSMTDDHRVIVSAEFTGSDSAIDRLRSVHGQPIREPLRGYPAVSSEFIRWHREPSLGGVFRAPGLPL